MARKILLADDSVTAQNMGRKILTDAGYDVITVNNGSAALKRVGEQKPDLIVLDVYMPGYSGLEVCVRLKDSPETARIPVLLTVGKLEPFKPEEASRVRADAYIVKPFEASELLSALTRLEDRMVPQADGARFSTTVSGIERFSSDPTMRKAEASDEDSGWRSRLRFPSKKKKEEPEPAPEDEIGVTPFRDFKKGAAKTAARGSFAVNSTPPATQEPGLVPDIPRDITPEELDALSELVAKLDGPIPASEDIAPLGESLAAAVSAPVEKKAEAKAVEETLVDQKIEKPQAETRTDEVKAEAASEVAQPEVAPAQAPEVASMPGPSEAVVDTPATEVTAESPAAAQEVGQAATPEIASVVEEQPSKAEPEAVAVVEPAAPEAALATTEVAADTQECPPHTKSEMPAASQAGGPQTESSLVVEEVGKKEDVSEEGPVKGEAAAADSQAAVETPKVEAATEPEPTAEPAEVATAKPEVSEPSPEDLAEALRLLTPSHVGGPTLAEAGAALAEELARTASPEPAPGHRWVAEKVALTAEESSLSLEAEMFRSFATESTGSAEPIAATSTPCDAPVAHEEEEAAEAAVEAAEAVAEEELQEAAVASQAAAIEEQARSVIAEVAAEPVKTESEPEKFADKSSEEPIDEDVAAVTFADAVRSEEAETVAAASAAEVSGSEEQQGEDDMAKDAKGKGKWHQIHSTPEPAAKADVVEAAKQSEEPPRTMAAAAASDGGSSDASTIASIVDSVLADLKPKIVEEIAKKLGKK